MVLANLQVERNQPGTRTVLPANMEEVCYGTSVTLEDQACATSQDYQIKHSDSWEDHKHYCVRGQWRGNVRDWACCCLSSIGFSRHVFQGLLQAQALNGGFFRQSFPCSHASLFENSSSLDLLFLVASRRGLPLPTFRSKE